MEGRTHHGLKWLAMGISSLALAACGLGQSDSTDVAVQGNWSGSYSAAGSQDSLPVFALIREGGAAYLYDGTGVVYVLPSFTGSEKLSGPVTAYPAMGYTFASGAKTMQLSMNGTAADDGIDVNFTGTGQGQSGQAQLSPLQTYFDTPSIASGQWTGAYLSPGPQALDLSVQADGSFTGDDAYGCHLQGRISPTVAQSPVYAVSMQSSGDSLACGGDMTGLVQESVYDTFGFFQEAPGTYYYLCASNAREAFVAEFKVQ